MTFPFPFLSVGAKLPPVEVTYAGAAQQNDGSGVFPSVPSTGRKNLLVMVGMAVQPDVPTLSVNGIAATKIYGGALLQPILFTCPAPISGDYNVTLTYGDASPATRIFIWGIDNISSLVPVGIVDAKDNIASLVSPTPAGGVSFLFGRSFQTSNLALSGVQETSFLNETPGNNSRFSVGFSVAISQIDYNFTVTPTGGNASLRNSVAVSMR